MNRPRIKPAHFPVQRPNGTLWIGSIHYGLGTELDDSSRLVWPVCKLMDGTRTSEELVRDAAVSTGAQPEAVAEVVDFLVQSGWVEDLGGPVPTALSARELERYARSVQFQSWIDDEPRASPYDLQARLKAARVTVLGLGGIGSAVAASLAASGVGELRCVDHDLVELTNLNRQLLFSEADIGCGKVDAAVRRLGRMNSDVLTTGRDMLITGVDDLREAIRGSTAFVLCADTPQRIDHWANEAALDLSIPWVVASYTGPMLSIGTFLPGRTGCYRCLTDGEAERMAAAGQVDLLDLPLAPGFNPVMAPTAQLAGQFAALELVYLIFGRHVQTAGRKFHWNYLDYEHHYFIEARPRLDCPACGARQPAAAGPR